MNSVMRFIVWGTIPIGALVGGALGTWIGLRETIVVGAIGGSLAILWIVFSPQRHLREMPEPIEDEPRTDELGAALPGIGDPLASDAVLTCGSGPRAASGATPTSSGSGRRRRSARSGRRSRSSRCR